ncbi:hypothetical protein G6011_07888 [Alternaria panax]|uniref:Uncharacterized protein n=1 Tax=Alternaria panax TaxID=48097 RepID=A0AAD4FD80_9PLEO|nr:hypothetical protein G6011_07888 [Alternaria panax]
MSDKLMDTEPGGERQNQYEGVHTFIQPHAKEAGQLGDPSEGTLVHKKTSDPGAPNTQGITSADKIRYGQSIQEGGMGGKTTSSTGEAKTESGFGGTEALNVDDDDAAKQRRAQGFGGDKDMDRTIGA